MDGFHKTTLNNDGVETEKDTLLFDADCIWEAFYCVDEDDPDMAQILFESIDSRFIVRMRLSNRIAPGHLFNDLLDKIEELRIED